MRAVTVCFVTLGMLLFTTLPLAARERNIYLAATLGHVQTINGLLESGAAKVDDYAGGEDDEAGDVYTALMGATQNGQYEAARFLILSGANVNLKGRKRGKTALHFAAIGGNTKIVRMLIASGADVNAKDQRGVTPLHSAMHVDGKKTAAILLAKGAEVNSYSEYGMTPLHQAIFVLGLEEKDDPGLPGLLIDNGADLNAKTTDGQTPLQMAEADGLKRVATLLRKSGAR